MIDYLVDKEIFRLQFLKQGNYNFSIDQKILKPIFHFSIF